MHSTQTSKYSYAIDDSAISARLESSNADELVEQVMNQALNQLTSLTGLGQRQVLQLLAKKYHISVEQHQHCGIAQLLNDEESLFIGNLFN
jgi:hypothetical protein